MQSLISKLNNHEASIAVIGLGYVGLPLACSLTEAGFLVTGIDLDKAKIKTLNNGNSYIQDIPDSKIAELNQLNYK